MRGGDRNDLPANKDLDRLLAEQSSELLEQVSAGDEKARRTLADWLLQSKRHVRTHLFMAALEEELKHIDPQRRIPVPDIRLAGKPVVATLSSSKTRTAVPQRRRRWTWAAAAALAALSAAALFAGLGTVGEGRWQELSTAVGEQRAVQLADGSIVQLNTGSHVRVKLSAAAREIRLIGGEALFKVHKDQSRPFNVYTQDATIAAVGTQFNVYRRAGSTRVSVIEGRVRVSATEEPAAAKAVRHGTPLLGAGEEAEIRRDGSIDRRQTPDAVNTAAWVQRRVVFKQEPLEQVVTEFNRYRKSPQFRVEDPQLAERKYSGTFDVDDPKSLEDVLANERDIDIERSGDAIVIRRAVDR